MNAPLKLSDDPIWHRDWLARLSVTMGFHGGRTILEHAAHEGPLRLQRPFFPEGPGCAHLYLLHPPGGMAPGDRLCIDIHSHPRSQTLVTTPSANRIYRTDAAGHPQVQTSHLRLAPDACLEWLPQETIVFDGAASRAEIRVDAADRSTLFLWDIVILGRAGSKAPFRSGSVRQELVVAVNGRKQLQERLLIQAAHPMMQATWGLQGAPIIATWICKPLPGTLRAARQSLDALPEEPEVRQALTQKHDLLIGRVLGTTIEPVRRCLQDCWARLRPWINGREACPPRIWLT